MHVSLIALPPYAIPQYQVYRMTYVEKYTVRNVPYIFYKNDRCQNTNIARILEQTVKPLQLRLT